MKIHFLIIVFTLFLMSCSNKDELLDNILIYDINDTHIETKLERYYKIRLSPPELFCNCYPLKFDTITYKGDLFWTNGRIVTHVYYHPDSINFTSDLNRIWLTLIRQSDSSQIFLSSENCNHNCFELVVTDIEYIDSLKGFYTAKFSGLMCDSLNINSLEIKSGMLFRATI